MNITHNFRTDIALERYQDLRTLWDTPLFESKSFVAVPTVGAFIEGWLLVVPREASMNFARLPDELWSEAEDFLAEVETCVQSEFGPVAIFEHGSRCQSSPVGCGVDYAHFHIVPVRTDVRAAAVRNFSDVNWKQYSRISDVRDFRSSNMDYWALVQREHSSSCWIGTTPNPVPPNQLFRRLLAQIAGIGDASFDWKNELGEKAISATVKRLVSHPCA